MCESLQAGAARQVLQSMRSHMQKPIYLFFCVFQSLNLHYTLTSCSWFFERCESFQAGAARQILQSMRSHMQKPNLLCHALVCLSKLAINNETAADVFRSGAIEVLCEV